jgi:hypothetical protein
MPFRRRDRETAKLEKLLLSARPQPDEAFVSRIAELAGGGQTRRRPRRAVTSARLAAVGLTAALLVAVVALGAGRPAGGGAIGAVSGAANALGLSGSDSSGDRFLASTCTYQDEHLVISNPGQQTAGAPFTVTVSAVAECAEGGGFFVDPGYSGPKTLTWGGAPCSPNCPANAPDGTAPSYPPNPVTFAHGSATVSITLYDAQTNVQLGVSDGTSSGESGAFDVVAGTASNLAFTGITFTSQNFPSGPPPCVFGCDISSAGNNPSWSSFVSVTDAHGNIEQNLGTAVTLTYTLTGTAGLTTPAGSTTIPASGTATTSAAFTWSHGTSNYDASITVSGGSFTSVTVAFHKT